MQPEPNVTYKKSSLPQSSQENTRDSQHGFPNSGEDLSHQLHAGQGRAQSWHSASITSSSAPSPGNSGPRERPLRRLSPPSKQKSRSPVDRIIEHEKDLTKLSKKRNEGRTFTVVQRGKMLGSAQLAIGDFPNGPHSTPASLRQWLILLQRS